jgi:hypothetical protein
MNEQLVYVPIADDAVRSGFHCHIDMWSAATEPRSCQDLGKLPSDDIIDIESHPTHFLSVLCNREIASVVLPAFRPSQPSTSGGQVLPLILSF